MHIKIVSPSSWNLGDSVTQLIKYSSKGLVGYDYSVLVKRAGEETAHWLKNIKVASDQIPLHVIAMGAYEGYGANRNGDAFTERALEDYHDTFTKYANHYRHHKNKDPDIRYGTVKASFYNKAMKRVELLSLLNATKEAAEKYGGFVADKELEMIGQGKDIPVSMACKVAYDVCSGCGNKARNRDEYCTEKGCKYGGCRDNLTKVASDGHMLFVYNPHPSFFDISTVIRPADRIAYGNVADHLQKAASCGGAALADAYGITLPVNVACSGIHDQYVVDLIKLAYKLADIEDTIESGVNQQRYQALARAFGPGVQQAIDVSPLGTVGTIKFASGLQALASQNVVLPIKDFLKLVIGDSEKYAEYAEVIPALLPGIYNRLIGSGELEREIRTNPFVPSQKLASVTQREWVSKIASDHSVDADDLRTRTAKSALRNIDEPTLLQRSVTKTAAATSEVESLARGYAMYKLAFLNHNYGCSSNSSFTTLIRDAVVLQNYTS